ncbi:MAG: LppA family lipoprotein [Nocardioidaceae bacterium]|uniref:hypothetical protein n=1 Tax=Corynebacterium sp. TaxID=1720 RepID=UPI002647F0B9|nr:hypothetical protein [Corynebacterium sp.]MDN5722030.1 LppA family lipoprotein [Corynebacterium sp.]MDN5744217.1 LppA family lipoprotein [Nocardioidaceae bacterium]
MSQPQPSIDDAQSAIDAAIDALEMVLHEVIPPEMWEEQRDGNRIGCNAHEARYSGPFYLAPGQQIPAETWPQIESVLAKHGFRTSSSMPLEGGSTFVHFLNDFGDRITVSSMVADAKGDGGSGYLGRTECHGGYTRDSDR